jgi:hypothetical protein
MGWTFTTGASRKEVMDDIRGWYGPKSPTATLTIVDEATTDYGRNWWVLYEYTPRVAERDPSLVGKRFICLYMLKGDADGWGYKDVSEEMGPYQKNCPLRILEQAEPPCCDYGYAPKWRQEVREYWEQEAKRLAESKRDWQPGDVCLINGERYKVIGPFSGYVRGRRGITRGYKVAPEKDPYAAYVARPIQMKPVHTGPASV